MHRTKFNRLLGDDELDGGSGNAVLNGRAGNDVLRGGDGRTYVRQRRRIATFDLAVVDPPTFSNSKRADEDWDIQRDHTELLNCLAQRMKPGGVIYFSTTFRRFKLDAAGLESTQVREISRQTVPPDFRNRRIHRCWRIIRA